MDPNHYNLRQELCWKMIWTTRKHHQRADMLLESIGLGSGQIRVLLELNRYGQLTQRELAEKTHVTPATVSGTLKRMEAAGLISRETDETDARVSIVKLTKTGEVRNAQARQMFETVDREMLEGISDEDCERMLKLLNIMQQNLARVTYGADEN